MDIEDLIQLALFSDRLSEEKARELMNFGISEILKAGASYSDALVILERAQLALHRSNMQKVTWGSDVSQ